MAEPENVSHIPPREVTLRKEELSSPRFTPRELRLIQEHVGKSFTEIVTDEAGDEKYAVFAWLKLRREGSEVTFAEMDDTVITIETTPPDPTPAPPPTISPHSADSGV